MSSYLINLVFRFILELDDLFVIHNSFEFINFITIADY